jgi:hypothetical protein
VAELPILVSGLPPRSDNGASVTSSAGLPHSLHHMIQKTVEKVGNCN